MEPDQIEQSEIGVIVDSSILFVFIKIGCLDKLISAFGHLKTTPLLKKEITNPEQLQMIEKLIAEGYIAVLQPSGDELYRAAHYPKKAYGKEISDADREAVAIAKCTGMLLLFEDTPMRKVANAANIDVVKMFDTVRCLQRLVDKGELDLDTARSHLARINSQRVIHRHQALKWD